MILGHRSRHGFSWIFWSQQCLAMEHMECAWLVSYCSAQPSVIILCCLSRRLLFISKARWLNLALAGAFIWFLWPAAYARLLDWFYRLSIWFGRTNTRQYLRFITIRHTIVTSFWKSHTMWDIVSATAKVVSKSQWVSDRGFWGELWRWWWCIECLHFKYCIDVKC